MQAKAGKNALVFATIFEQLVKKQFIKAEERQASFNEMITVALETAVSLE
jgi:purine-nucleoside phosphorylase